MISTHAVSNAHSDMQWGWGVGGLPHQTAETILSCHSLLLGWLMKMKKGWAVAVCTSLSASQQLLWNNNVQTVLVLDVATSQGSCVGAQTTCFWVCHCFLLIWFVCVYVNLYWGLLHMMCLYLHTTDHLRINCKLSTSCRIFGFYLPCQAKRRQQDGEPLLLHPFRGHWHKS